VLRARSPRPPVPHMGGGVFGAWRREYPGARPRAACGIIELRRGDTPRAVVAAGDQNLAVRKHGRGVVSPRRAEAGEREPRLVVRVVAFAGRHISGAVVAA